MRRALCLVCLLISVPFGAIADPLVIFAAASLRGALDEIVRGYDGDVAVSYGGSGAMAQQIARGAPADLYLSANVAWVDWLQEQGEDGARVDLLSNRLVLITNQGLDSAERGDVFAAARRSGLALGQTLSVPVGIYARQSLEALDEWDSLRGAVIEFPSASAVLRAVELGEVPAGVVYVTDAQQSQRVAHVDILDDSTHEAITYPMMLLSPTAEPMFALLQSETAADVFRRYGFVVVADR